VVLRSRGFHAVLLYRLARAARDRGGPAGRAAAALAGLLVRWAYRSVLSPAAELHGGLILPHPDGIVVGPGAVVGARAWLFQHVTVGGAPGRSGMPRIGSDARIYAGAVIAGPVTLGDEVTVGANAVVVDDVPSRCTVRVGAQVTVSRGGSRVQPA
jgi:serine O-acetyltransferase